MKFHGFVTGRTEGALGARLVQNPVQDIVLQRDRSKNESRTSDGG